MASTKAVDVIIIVLLFLLSNWIPQCKSDSDDLLEVDDDRTDDFYGVRNIHHHFHCKGLPCTGSETIGCCYAEGCCYAPQDAVSDDDVRDRHYCRDDGMCGLSPLDPTPGIVLGAIIGAIIAGFICVACCAWVYVVICKGKLGSHNQVTPQYSNSAQSLCSPQQIEMRRIELPSGSFNNFPGNNAPPMAVGYSNFQTIQGNNGPPTAFGYSHIQTRNINISTVVPYQCIPLGDPGSLGSGYYPTAEVIYVNSDAVVQSKPQGSVLL